MAQSLSQLWVHIIFSTKGRYPYLDPRTVRVQVHRYIAGICRKLGCPALMVGGVEDHVHILCNLSRNIPVMRLVQQIKGGSSTWIKNEWPHMDHFHWQNGYAALSVCQSHRKRVAVYIEGQEEHHQHQSFKDELRTILKTHEVPFDEKYIWD